MLWVENATSSVPIQGDSEGQVLTENLEDSTWIIRRQSIAEIYACVAICCNKLQYVAICFNLLQSVATCRFFANKFLSVNR